MQFSNVYLRICCRSSLGRVRKEAILCGKGLGSSVVYVGFGSLQASDTICSPIVRSLGRVRKDAIVVGEIFEGFLYVGELGSS